MHKLVHAWAQDRLEIGRQRQLSFLALELMAEETALEGVEPSHRLRLVPHVMASFGVSSRVDEPLYRIAQDKVAMTDSLGSFLYRLGRWSKAYEVQIFHFTKIKMMLGEEKPDTLTSMNSLASTYRNQGRWKEAEQLDVQVMETTKRVLGEEHPNTLTSMNNLAFTWKRQGRSGKAIDMMGECVHLRTQVLGAKHPDTWSSSSAFTRWQIQEPRIISSAASGLTAAKGEQGRLDKVSLYIMLNPRSQKR